MTLTKAGITGTVTDRLKHMASEVADMDDELLTILHDLSARGDLLIASTTQTLADKTPAYDKPDYCKSLLHLNVTGKDYLKRMDYAKYRTYMSNNSQPPTFVGSGLSDLTRAGNFTGSTYTNYRVQIDAEGTPDTFKWSADDGATWDTTGVAITGSAQTLEYGITVTFAATTGHTDGDYWTIPALGWTSAEGDPDEYAEHGDKYYLYPVPNTTYTLNISYSKYHNPATTTIEFADRFVGVIVEGVLRELWSGVLGRHDPGAANAMKHSARYENMVRDMAAQIDTDPPCVRYRDM